MHALALCPEMSVLAQAHTHGYAVNVTPCLLQVMLTHAGSCSVGALEHQEVTSSGSYLMQIAFQHRAWMSL
jgi:hypothetical protein